MIKLCYLKGGFTVTMDYYEPPVRLVVAHTWSELPACPDGCVGITGPPYCHCEECGETGVPISEQGLCEGCQAREDNPAEHPDPCPYCRGDERAHACSCV